MEADRIIILVEPQQAHSDGFGQMTSTGTINHEVYAAVEYKAGGDTSVDSVLLQTWQRVYTTRWLPKLDGLDNSWSLRDNDRVFEIKNVVEIGRRYKYQLFVTAKEATS